MKITIHDGEHWVTAHPNGREEKGTPLLIEGSNGHYVVKGGAGGKLNGTTVNPKSMSKGKESGGTESGTETTPAQGNEAPAQSNEPVPQYTEKLKHSEAHEKFKAALKEAGIQHRVSKFPMNTNIAPKEYGKEWSTEEHKTINQLAIKHGYTGSMGHPIDPNPTTGFGGQMYFVHGHAKTVGEAAAAAEAKAAEAKNIESSGHAEAGKRAFATGGSFSPRENLEFMKSIEGLHINEQIKALREYGAGYESEYNKLTFEQKEARKNAIREAKIASAANSKYAEMIRKRDQETRNRIDAQAKVGNNRKPFTPAKSSKEAASFAISNNLADHASYGKIDVEVANTINDVLQTTLTKFPALRNAQRFVGSAQEHNKNTRDLAVHQLLPDALSKGWSDNEIENYIKRQRPSKVSGSCRAMSSQYGVSVNELYGGDPVKFLESKKRSVERQWNPIGCDSIKATIDHEYGHQLDDLLGLSNSSQFLDIRRRYSKSQVIEGLSEYASTKHCEYIAEAWAEYVNNPNPRPMSVEIGKLIESQYDIKFGKRA